MNADYLALFQIKRGLEGDDRMFCFGCKRWDLKINEEKSKVIALGREE